MSVNAPLFYCMPAETAEVAQAAFPKGNVYIRMHDELGMIYTNPLFTHLFPRDGQPAKDPARLALVLIMAFAEGLSDRQAADAVRSRIDWKYALALPLRDAGFDSSVLCEFRGRLLAGQAERLLFDTLLDQLRERKLVQPGRRQRTDSTHVLAAIHVLNRLECVGETLRHALNTLATVAPDWLRSWVPPVWFDRYSQRIDAYRLPPGKPERYRLAEQMGADGHALLTALYADTTPLWFREVPAVQLLREVWMQQFYAPDAEQFRHWRTADDLPPAPSLISSPYDQDARYSRKRTTEWTGYKVHLTESCDDDTPHLITHVETTLATTPDSAMTGLIQEQLAAHDLLPSEHIVDAGYMTADYLVESQKQAVDLVGPLHPEPGWQAKAHEGFAASNFVIDWEGQRATCPQGKTSVIWQPTRNREGHDSVTIRFAAADCHGCAVRAQCVSSTRSRALTVRAHHQYVALQAARQRQTSEAFKAQYKTRAGIEGTISQAVRLGDLRRSRYIGLAKTRLMHFLLATALNVMRFAAWLADTRRAATRRSSFGRLAGAPI
ncbi:MAG: IS1182 family transposase [Herpetosiphonaceae bacterium]|nr:IS1182 family transposase [Herpetosiphonaceae bacterium]